MANRLKVQITEKSHRKKQWHELNQLRISMLSGLLQNDKKSYMYGDSLHLFE